ncbi:CU044_2847 family protein [Streptomyces sp. NPDC086549]|uniref:CU044_2847 family protein n=1 Tax=Streptomyces sp. NPDC086549 TaxID=3365752 RepID=UPI00380B74C9
MGRLVEFKTEDGGVVVVVETADPTTGSRLVSRGEGPAAQTARTFEGALDGVRAAAQSALRVFRDGALRPDSVELEFGVKLTAEAGAVIAKGAAEGQLVVRLSWASGQGSPAAPDASEQRPPESVATVPSAAEPTAGS